MEEEVKYTSEFDGQTTDEVLKHAKSVKDLTIPSLSNISGFVCIDNEGKAIGMMSKEDIAQVVGGLIKGNFATKEEYKSVSLSKGESTYIDFLRFGTGNFLLSIRATSSNTEYLSLYDIFYVSIYASSSKNITSFNYMNNIETILR